MKKNKEKLKIASFLHSEYIKQGNFEMAERVLKVVNSSKKVKTK